MTARRRRHYTLAQVVGPLLLLLALALVALWLSRSDDRATSSRNSTRATTSTSRSQPRRDETLTVDAADLPAEARATLRLIASRGPFPYSRDGVVFENRQRLLPRQERGYYHEYTVPTPGSRDRGARRIITGRSGQKWYSPDHYRTFVRIRQ